jgi:hypothetical protein
MLVAPMFALACHREPTAPAQPFHALLQSEQTSYTATLIGSGAAAYYGFTVVVRYVNQGNAPIYIERCGGSSQPLVGVQPFSIEGDPVGSTDQVPFACGSDSAFVVQPGSFRRDTLTLAAPSTLPANVRLFYLAHSFCNSMGGACTPLLPESDRVSSTIQVQVAP